jgi:hypothetical protein
MRSQRYSMFSIPAGCHHTQQDGESICDKKKQALANLSIKNMYMQTYALLIRKLFAIFEANCRQSFRFKFKILKATELLLWLTQYSINKFRFRLIKSTRALSQPPPKSSFLTGYINSLKVSARLNAHIQELAKGHEFLFGHYPNGIGLRTDAWTTNNNNK